MQAATVAGQGAPGMSTKMAILRSTRTGTRLTRAATAWCGSCTSRGLRLHTGGEFKKVSGVLQNTYARLSPASL
jgi:hypothetical protein